MIVAGRLVSPEGSVFGQIRIEGDRIVDVGPSLGTPDYAFGDSCLIFAGMGDIHIHARDDVSGRDTHKEDFRTASAAAIHGGVVHLADMPNNPVAPVDDVTYAAKERHLNESHTDVHFTLYAGIGPGTRPLTRPVPYKVYMGPSVGDLFFTSPQQLEDTLAHYRGCSVSFHCEDPKLLNQHASAPTHEQRRPPDCEVSATRFALEMIEKYDLVGKLCHYSVRDGLPLIQRARERGVRVTCEVTPHHLYFDQLDIDMTNRGLMQMNPPLRARTDRLAMLDALRNGTLDYLATDHAPHTIEEKTHGTNAISARNSRGQAHFSVTTSSTKHVNTRREMSQTPACERLPSGLPHLDTYGAFVTWLICEQNFSPERIAAVCSANPGQFVNSFAAPHQFGRIEPGYSAALTVLNLDRPTTIHHEELKTKCGWSPFEGVTFPGSVEAVFIDGKRLA